MRIVKAALGEAEGQAELCLTAFRSHCCGILFVSLFETGSHFAAQAGLELALLSPQHPAVWGSAPVLPCLARYHVFKIFLNSFYFRRQ